MRYSFIDYFLSIFNSHSYLQAKRVGARIAQPLLGIIFLMGMHSFAIAAPDFDKQKETLTTTRSWAEYQYKVAEKACYDKFFTNACINRAKDVLREKQHDFRKQELAINEAERAENVRIREAREAEQKRLDAQEAAQRAADEKANRDAYREKILAYQAREAERNAKVPPHPAAITKAEQKRIEAAQQNGVAQQQERAQNVKNYQQKVEDANKRRADVERRKAAAAEKAAKRAAEKQAKEDAAKAALKKVQ